MIRRDGTWTGSLPSTVAASLTAALACASQPPPEPAPAPESAYAYLPDGDGWVELLLLDSEVPADPIRELAGEGAAPPTCELEVEIDGTSVSSRTLAPSGVSPPYSAEATIGFAASPGMHAATVYYSSCRNAGGRPDSLEAALRIHVRSGWVTRLRYDGRMLRADPPVPR